MQRSGVEKTLKLMHLRILEYKNYCIDFRFWNAKTIKNAIGILPTCFWSFRLSSKGVNLLNIFTDGRRIQFQYVRERGPNNILFVGGGEGMGDRCQYLSRKSRQIVTQSSYPMSCSQAYKVVWPKELRRYGDKKVTKRAKMREDEQCYHPLENNCEHFTTWCKCGLNISLQARLWCLWARQIINKILAKGNEIIENIVPVLLRVLANVSNESVVAFASMSFAESLIKNLVEKGFINTAVISDIKEVFDKWISHDSSDKLLQETLVQMIKKTVCKFMETTRSSASAIASSMYQVVKGGFGYDSVDGDEDDESTEQLFNEFIEWCKNEDKN